MTGFLQALEAQRHDDHRYYHHSTVNQTLHFMSACTFLASYVMLFTHPVVAVLVGWVVAMVSRQIGHFFFEPKGYDAINQATHAEKEAIKLGYNLRRKAILMAVWIASPLVVLVEWIVAPPADPADLLRHLAIIWAAIAFIALLGRAAQLCIVKDVRTGVAWFVKILTDPFHDIKLYHRAPLHLLRGRLLDPETPAVAR